MARVTKANWLNVKSLDVILSSDYNEDGDRHTRNETGIKLDIHCNRDTDHVARQVALIFERPSIGQWNINSIPVNLPFCGNYFKLERFFFPSSKHVLVYRKCHRNPISFGHIVIGFVGFARAKPVKTQPVFFYNEYRMNLLRAAFIPAE